MRFPLKLLTEEVVVACIDLALIPTLYNTRMTNTGIAYYLETTHNFSLDIYTAFALVCAGYAFYKIFYKNKRVGPYGFGFVSIPLLFYIGVLTGLVIDTHKSAGSLVAIGLLYMYFLGQVILRAIGEQSYGRH